MWDHPIVVLVYAMDSNQPPEPLMVGWDTEILIRVGPDASLGGRSRLVLGGRSRPGTEVMLGGRSRLVLGGRSRWVLGGRSRVMLKKQNGYVSTRRLVLGSRSLTE